MLTFLCYLFLGLFIYNVPALIALGRFHNNMRRILLMNVALGWTVIGWLWAFGMALQPAKADYK